MEPAVYCLAILRPQPPHLWTRLQAELDSQGSPPIAFEQRDGAVTFEAQTGAFMVRARVADALDAVWAHGEWQRLFRPVD
jgi:hypothetical protein